MRTVILLGAICISDAINKDWMVHEDSGTFFGITIVIMFAFDVIELIKKC